MKKGLRRSSGTIVKASSSFESRPYEEGIKTSAFPSNTLIICGLNRDLMKKGLRLDAGGIPIGKSPFESRPYEEGIKTLAQAAIFWN